MSIDISQFLSIFYEESFEGLQAMESGLLGMTPGIVDQDIMNAVFRAAHSIKGGGGTFGLNDVSDFTHVVETLLDEMRSGEREMTSEAHELLLQSVDCLHAMLVAKQTGKAVDEVRNKEIQHRLHALLDDEAVPSPSLVQPSQPQVAGWLIDFKPHPNLFHTANDPLRILRELGTLGEMEFTAETKNLPDFGQFNPEECLLSWNIQLKGDIPRESVSEVFEWVEDDCELKIKAIDADIKNNTLQIEETLTSNAAGKLTEKKAVATPEKIKDGGSIRVSTGKIDSLINIVGELVITQAMLSQLRESFDMSRLEQLSDGLAQLTRNTRELQESVLGIRMLPISFAFNRFPRMVHDISNKLGKKVELVMSGETTEVDKTVMEMIGDPLVHLVRNAIDHGIEPPHERLAAGKPELGTVQLNAYHRGGNIIIEIIDTGAGINHQRLLKKAVESGIVSPNSQLTDDEILELVFHPGLSTTENVSDLSGRGVGMDVVRSNIRELGGSVDVTTESGKGSTFTIRLPLTLAILDGQTISVGEEIYIIPLVSIVESIQVRPDMLNMIAGKGETFKLREEYLPIIRLHDIFRIESARATNLTDGILVVVEGEGRRCGLLVDKLTGQQQVVIKSLDDNYKRVEGVSGATILGDGSVALILDLPGLIRLANQTHARPDDSARSAA